MKKLLMAVSLAASALVFQSGCVSGRASGMEISQTEGMTAFVQADDGFFRSTVEVAESHMFRTEFGFLKACTMVRNSRNDDFPIQYKFAWFDANGMEIQPGGRPWEQTTIHGHETVSLSGTAPEQSAVKYTLRLRRVK